jgi:hypothetical protein
MHKLTRSRILITLLTLSFLLACFTGCGEDDDDGDSSGEALTLPPDSSMTMDLSAFDGDKLGAPVPTVPGAQLNFGTAAMTALVVNTTVVVKLATPVAVFTNAKTATPVEQDDGSWLWSYSRTIGLRTFSANLTGKDEGDKITWSMRISSDTIPLDNFEWYKGTSAKDNNSGSWQFFDPGTPDQANPTYAIEWQVERGVKRERTFTNQEAGSPDLGNVLLYSVEGDMAGINFTEAAKDTTTIIEWNFKTTAGSITAPFYNKGEKACWNENKQNVACP